MLQNSSLEGADEDSVNNNINGRRYLEMFSLYEHASFDILKTYFCAQSFYINWVWHVMLYPVYLYTFPVAD